MLYGTIINGISIIIGSILGMFLTKIHERYKETIMQGIGIMVMIIGLQMAFETDSVIIVLLSVMAGAIIGEFLRLEALLDRVGYWIASKIRNKDESTNVAQGFVTASLIFVVGAMSILGSLDSGLRGDHELLLLKSILDGFIAFVLATTLGLGVVFSVVPVVLFQGTITLLATRIESLLPDAMFDALLIEVTAVGGLLIVAIGLNILKITKIRVTNLLPSILMVILFVAIKYLMG